MTTFQKTHWRLWIAPLLMGGALIMVAVILFTSTPSAAKPAVTWTPSSVNQIILPGGTDTVSVSFTASRNLSNVSVYVVPELQAHVAVTPSDFGSINKGETKTLQLSLSVPLADPLLGSFVGLGTVHLQSGNGASQKTYARPLPVSIFGLPPDPGEVGEATLEGIDSDGDGMRDDIQRFIALTHSDSARTRAALTQFASENFQALLDADSEEDSIDHARVIGHAIECLFYIHGEDAPDVSDPVHAAIFNTVERSRAYLTYNAQLGGEVFPSSPVNLWNISCAFDPDALPN